MGLLALSKMPRESQKSAFFPCPLIPNGRGALMDYMLEKPEISSNWSYAWSFVDKMTDWQVVCHLMRERDWEKETVRKAINEGGMDNLRTLCAECFYYDLF